MISRRQAIVGMSVSAAAATLGCSEREPVVSRERRSLDFGKPSDNLYGLLKLMGDLSGKRTCYYQPGRIFAHRDGELPAHLLNYTGVTIREIRQVSETRYASRYGGWMLMRDPETNAVVDEWRNPWDQSLREVEHFVSDIGKQSFDENGLERPANFDGDFSWFDKSFVLPWQVIGDDVWAPYEQFSRYTDRRGNKRYENAIHTYHGKLSDLEDVSLSSAQSSIASQSQSPYFPWMGGDNPGHMILTSLGRKLESVEHLPKFVRDDVTQRYPNAMSIEFDWENADR